MEIVVCMSGCSIGVGPLPQTGRWEEEEVVEGDREDKGTGQ